MFPFIQCFGSVFSKSRSRCGSRCFVESGSRSKLLLNPDQICIQIQSTIFIWHYVKTIYNLEFFSSSKSTLCFFLNPRTELSFLNMKFSNIFLFWGRFWLAWLGILISNRIQIRWPNWIRINSGAWSVSETLLLSYQVASEDWINGQNFTGRLWS